jgi:energy-coupling factor transporter ATP-binding protein EcfA2
VTKIEITSSCPVRKTPRVAQMSALFDVPVEARAVNRWTLDIDLDARPWSVGLVVGPSGSGKSTLARELWPAEWAAKHEWDPEASILDAFPAGMGIKEVAGHLTGVGLSSPPAWLRPHHTLSGGEAFRADMARSLAEAKGSLVCVDEFTSVVDRQVAKVASHAVQKAVRRQSGQLVAVTCHYDVIDWLQPDWVVDMVDSSFAWRSVQPHPRLDLEVFAIDRAAWRAFARHHYLSSALATGAQCYGGFIGGQCVAFTSYIHFPHPHTRNIKAGHRLVVLPDYQGLGIAGRLDDWLGQHLYEQGFRYHNTIAHPSMINYYSRSPRWREIGGRRSLSTTSTDKTMRARALDPRFLGTRSFEYTPPVR